MADNQPRILGMLNKNRMHHCTRPFDDFAARLQRGCLDTFSGGSVPQEVTACLEGEGRFSELALELFELQFGHVAPYRRISEARDLTPSRVRSWRELPAVPTTAFKTIEFTSLPPALRTTIFQSSGSTQQRPSRHIHNAASLALYECALRAWFAVHLLPETSTAGAAARPSSPRLRFLALTPEPRAVPHSSLVHMFATVMREWGSPASSFLGRVDAHRTWRLETERALESLAAAAGAAEPVCVLGTAFGLVQLLEALDQVAGRIQLAPGSRVLETGGYKGRSRALPRAELYAWIGRALGVPPSHIVSEYGMCELSSQAYDLVISKDLRHPEPDSATRPPSGRQFRFPPWARALVISPETGREVGVGEAGLLRVVDLANVWSVLAVQTEDLVRRQAQGFEYLSRAQASEWRGCSWMSP